MEQLIAHLVGDYVLQNHWMATNKVKAWIPAIVHVTLYSILFLFLADNWHQMAVISGMHLLIDRFRLAKYWVQWWGVGEPGIWFSGSAEQYLEKSAPPFLAVWLLIIVDNTIHLAINWASLTWL